MLEVAAGSARRGLLDGVLGAPGGGLYQRRWGVLGRPRSSDSGELVLIVLRLKKIEQGHQEVRKEERKRGGKDSAAGAHRVGRDSRK